MYKMSTLQQSVLRHCKCSTCFFMGRSWANKAQTMPHLEGFVVWGPKHRYFLEKQCILSMTHHYGIGKENWGYEDQEHTISSTQEFLSLMRSYRGALIDLYKLICICLTLPVTPVSCENSFFLSASFEKQFEQQQLGPSNQSHSC